MQGHEDTVREIQKQVKSRSEPISIRAHAPSNTLRTRAKGGISLGPFNKILEFGADWVRVEPRITFQELCRETLERGVIPPVVPEFTTITVGGAVMGAALESS